MILKYDVIGAYKVGENRHPAKVIQALGMNVLVYKFIPLGDFAVIEVNTVVGDLLPYITQYTPTEEDIKVLGL